MTEHAAQQPDGCGTDVAAYALGALAGGDEALFRVHLMTCSVCPDELAAFEEVIEALAMTAPLERAPETLRNRVLAEARHDAGHREPARRRARWPGLSRRTRS
jgi:hypothetical protein